MPGEAGYALSLEVAERGLIETEKTCRFEK